MTTTSETQSSEVKGHILVITGEPNVVGGDGVQEEPVKAWKVSVDLKHRGQRSHKNYEITQCEPVLPQTLHLLSALPWRTGDSWPPL